MSYIRTGSSDDLPGALLELTSIEPQAAREFIWLRVREGYYRHGFKVWWLYACESEIRPLDPDNLCYHLGNGLAVTNIYPLLHARAFYDGMQPEGESEIITFSRSAQADSQRYATAVWSGDIQSTFETMQTQVTAGLNIGLVGFPGGPPKSAAL